MIYTVTLNPALDKTVEIPSLRVGAVNRITAMRTDPGGKGINVSKVIRELGGESTAVGILGGNIGRMIQDALEVMGIKTGFVFSEGETRTNLKVIDPVSHTNTDINEPGCAVPAEVLNGLLEDLQKKLRRGDIVVLSGSLPGGAPKDTYGIWVRACKESGAKVFLDVDGELMASGIEEGPCLIKPNDNELSVLTGKKLRTPEELDREARGLMKNYGIAKAVVSMGERGALYLMERETIYAEGLRVPVRSTVGAGDSMVAALAVSEEAGSSPEDIVRLSIACGAANVMCSGTQAAEYDMIRKLMPEVVFHKL